MLLRKRDKHELPRPIIRPEMGPADLILEILAIVSLLGFIGFTLYFISRLPDSVPTHFDASGKPDDFGSKASLWMLPVVALVLYAILSLVSRIPEKFNYPVKITQANARRQYTLGVRLIRCLKLAMILMFFFISYKTVMVAQANSGGLGIWFFPVLIGIILIPIIIYFILALTNK
ncbi:MAG: DUF1648 domain-containing protein [Bacteroidales bacterium]|nr:DUF1648 domain-containing protein [Bacteroidales bacterium]